MRAETLDLLLAEFAHEFNPLQSTPCLLMMTDKKNGAHYCECHIKASVLARLCTTNGPLDPQSQAEFRANRDVRLNHPAFVRMKEDARSGRSFSNIVAEYTKEFDPAHPLKIVGGQHRFEAIQYGLAHGVDEFHGVKVYFALNKEQRMDVQLISNTTIAVSSALFDRMDETSKGRQLRDWCTTVGLLEKGDDFSDQHSKGAISVRLVRSFITNYMRGRSIDLLKFDKSETTPIICPSGDHDEDWEQLKRDNPDLWTDDKLRVAGEQFAKLVQAQRAAFDVGGAARPKDGKRPKADHPDKALNIAVVTAWAFVAGSLSSNETRLSRHYSLSSAVGKDPLNAESLAKGRYRTDSPNYRGLGNRTDPKERGRLVELFYLQTDKGQGITPSMIQNAIKKYEIKIITLELTEESETTSE